MFFRHISFWLMLIKVNFDLSVVVNRAAVGRYCGWLGDNEFQTQKLSEEGIMVRMYACMSVCFFYGARPQDSVLLASVCRYMSYSRLLDSRAKESRVVRHVKPPSCGEVSRKPRGRHRSHTKTVQSLPSRYCTAK